MLSNEVELCIVYLGLLQIITIKAPSEHKISTRDSISRMKIGCYLVYLQEQLQRITRWIGI